MIEKDFDVIVVGSGPAGALTSKKLAEAGKKVLMIEKKSLPRHKICSGLISREAQSILKRESLPIPKAICARPKIGKGVKIQKNMNFNFFKVPDRFFNVFRRDFDYWLVIKASEAGAEILSDTEFINFSKEGKNLAIKIKTRNDLTNQAEEIELGCDYLIGADGGSSTVRKVLFPDFKYDIAVIYQEYYKGESDLDPRYFHAFLDKRLSDGYAWFNQKDCQLIIGVGALKGSDIQRFQAKFIEYLEEGYGLRLESKIRKEGCIEPNILSRDFRPGFKLGEDNVILIGEAAGLMNLFGEGIPAALKSGIIAANCIISHKNKNEPIFNSYLHQISELKQNLTTNWENLEDFLAKIE